jgi:hypothetical protein
MSSFPVNIYERESTELLTVTVQKNRIPVTNDVFLTVIDSDNRPVESNRVPATITSDNKCGILIDGLEVGTYSVWVRVINTPEDAVFRAGVVKII